MISRLNPWQRFWGMFAIVLFVSTLVVMVALWPRRDAGIVADLGSPACRVWFEMPEGMFPDAEPEVADPCHALRTFLYRHRVAIRTLADYDHYRVSTGVRNSATVLAAWAGFVGAFYLFGWAGASIARHFVKARQPRTESIGDSVALAAASRDHHD